jgi:hypothetical protein
MTTFHERRAALRPLAALALSLPVVSAYASTQTSGNRAAVLDASERLKAAWNRRDPSAISAMFWPDGTASATWTGGVITGPAAIAARVQASVLVPFPDFNVQVLDFRIAEDGTMFQRWVATGTWAVPFPSGPLAGVPASGRRFTIGGASWLSWEQELLRRYEGWNDQLSLLGQIGALGSLQPRPSSEDRSPVHSRPGIG